MIVNRWRRLVSLQADSFPVWFALLALAGCALVLVRAPAFQLALAGPQITLGAPQLLGATKRADAIDLACCSSPGQVESHANWGLKLVGNRSYIVEAILENHGVRDASPVVVDLVGETYDSMEQEFHVSVPARRGPVIARKILPSGTPPERVVLRIFHSAPTTISVRGVSVRQASGASFVLVLGAGLLLLVTFVAASISGVAALRNGLATRRSAIGDSRVAWLVLGGLALAVAGLLNSMIGPPIVMADEFLYRAATAAASVAATSGVSMAPDLPNRLFFVLFALADGTQSPFPVARALNAIGLGLGIAALYMASRLSDGRTPGLAVAVGYSFGTLASYSAYFMPEVLFGVVYIGSTIGIAAGLANGGLVAGALGGTLLAALTYVKPHGWVVVAAFLSYAAFRSVTVNPEMRRSIWHAVAIAAAGFVCAWALLDLLLPGGRSSSGILGATYGGMLAAVERASLNLDKYLQSAAVVGVEVALAGVVSAPALLYAGWSILRVRTHVDERTERFSVELSRLSFVALIALMVMAAVFAASIAGVGPSETVNRLHWRYFNFVLPLLVIGAAASRSAETFFSQHRTIVLAVWSLACFSSLLVLPRMVWGFVDSPELFFGWGAPVYVYPAFGIVAVGACILLRRVRKVVGWAMVIAYTVNALVAGVYVRHTQLTAQESAEDRVGQYMALMARELRIPAYLVGDVRGAEFYRVASHIPEASRLTSIADLRGELVRMGYGPSIVAGPRDDLARAGFVQHVGFGTWGVAMVGREGDQARDADASSRNAPLVLSFGKRGREAAMVEGLHPPEDWGAWSAADSVSVSLPREVSGRVVVALRAHALAGNVGRAIRIELGDQGGEITLAREPTESELVLDLKRPTKSVTIRGFRQFSQQESGVRDDSRSLGVALWGLRITEGP